MSAVISNALTIGNGKGGVGKSSLASNLAGLAAMAGWNPLLIDLDPQGNLGRDLGYRGGDLDDGGFDFAQAVMSRGQQRPRAVEVREGLHVVPGGPHTEDLASVLTNRRSAEPEAITAVGQAVMHLAEEIQPRLIIFDTPPATSSLVDAALAASRWLLIPTKADGASFDGLETIARKVAPIRESFNPLLEIIGVVLFGIDSRGTRIRADARAELERDLEGTGIPVFDGVVREAGKAARDMRGAGQLAHEHAEEAQANAGEVFAALRDNVQPPARTYSSAAGGLAGDYMAIAGELLGSITNSLAEAA